MLNLQNQHDTASWHQTARYWAGHYSARDLLHLRHLARDTCRCVCTAARTQPDDSVRASAVEAALRARYDHMVATAALRIKFNPLVDLPGQHGDRGRKPVPGKAS